MSTFGRRESEELLARCHRRCCVCQRFCGVKIELDHIVPVAEGGTNEIENAIPVCFECHAEIHSYNDRHPRGRKFRPEELHLHRNQWLDLVAERPDILTSSSRDRDVGPLQALSDELEFNLSVVQHNERPAIGCLFRESQFERAIREGVISLLEPTLKAALLEAYRLMGRANNSIRLAADGDPVSVAGETAVRRLKEAQESVEQAHESLMKFLVSESGQEG